MSDDNKSDNIIPIDGNKMKTAVPQKKEVGQVTEQERDEIQHLYERRNGLVELSKTLLPLSKEELSDSPLYEKVTVDLGTVSVKFQTWWDTMSRKYNWESRPNGKWEIDFATGKIFLVF